MEFKVRDLESRLEGVGSPGVAALVSNPRCVHARVARARVHFFGRAAYQVVHLGCAGGLERECFVDDRIVRIQFITCPDQIHREMIWRTGLTR